MTALTPIEGKDVLRTDLILRRTGDGLSQAMTIDPQEFHQGDRVFILYEAVMADLAFKPIDRNNPGGPQARVQVFHAEVATIVDNAFARDRIELQREKNQEAKDQAAGQEVVPGVREAEKKARTTRTRTAKDPATVTPIGKAGGVRGRRPKKGTGQ